MKYLKNTADCMLGLLWYCMELGVWLGSFRNYMCFVQIGRVYGVMELDYKIKNYWMKSSVFLSYVNSLLKVNHCFGS
jgi:hypothetical protein